MTDEQMIVFYREYLCVFFPEIVLHFLRVYVWAPHVLNRDFEYYKKKIKIRVKIVVCTVDCQKLRRTIVSNNIISVFLILNKPKRPTYIYMLLDGHTMDGD